MNSHEKSHIEEKISVKSNDKWRAWLNTMPGSSHRLHVVGEIETGGVSLGCELKFSELEKSNPPNLILMLETQHIFVPREPGNTKVEVHYSDTAEVGEYNVIYIQYPDGRVIIDNISIAT